MDPTTTPAPTSATPAKPAEPVHPADQYVQEYTDTLQELQDVNRRVKDAQPWINRQKALQDKLDHLRNNPPLVTKMA